MNHLPVKEIYKTPLILGLLIVAGLLFALLGDGIWDALSWCLLSIPLLIAAYFLFRRRGPASRFDT
jgi:hypothetical protein